MEDTLILFIISETKKANGPKYIRQPKHSTFFSELHLYKQFVVSPSRTAPIIKPITPPFNQ